MANNSIKLGSQVKFASDDSRKGAVVRLDGETATVKLRGTTDTVEAPVSDLRGVRGRPLTIKA